MARNSPGRRSRVSVRDREDPNAPTRDRSGPVNTFRARVRYVIAGLNWARASVEREGTPYEANMQSLAVQYLLLATVPPGIEAALPVGSPLPGPGRTIRVVR